MSSADNPIPKAYRGVIPSLAFKDAAEAIAWYKTAFSATELYRLMGPGDKIGHAELKIGDALVMLSDEFPGFNNAPATPGGAAVVLVMWVEDVDSFVAQAIDNGARLIFPVKDQFYGDRSGRIADPFGYMWIISTHTEDVSPTEMQRRLDATDDSKNA
jgi:PhnB protein